jgi:outer membrane protein assembly factor BamB
LHGAPRLLFLGGLFAISTLITLADDWPQFLGPARNGVSTEKVASSWEKSEPKQLWKKKIGAGFAGPVVSGNTLIIFHRDGNSEILLALDSETGQPKWESKSPTAYRDDFGFDEGPRAVPCIQEGRVYAMGAEGLIRCVDFANGKEIWSVPAKTQFKAAKGYFGMVCSPLVQGDLLILNIGGADGAGVVALDKTSGKLRWKATGEEASYSSPVPAVLDGKTNVVVFTREGVVLLDPRNGRELGELHWRSRMQASVNAATPLVVGNKIFLSASYDTGAVLLEWVNGSLKKLWSGDESLSSHYATPVYRDGYLYGFHGRQEYGPSFRCVEFATGKVLWDQPGFGAGTVTLAGDQLLILRESGELVLAAATPTKYELHGSTQVLGSGTRAAPALAGHRFYARDKSTLVCLRLP